MDLLYRQFTISIGIMVVVLFHFKEIHPFHFIPLIRALLI